MLNMKKWGLGTKMMWDGERIGMCESCGDDWGCVLVIIPV